MTEKRKYTLLIVDDEPIISDGLKILFEEEFPGVFQIYNCYYPLKAIEIFKFFKPDIVVSDIKMPKMTGIEMVDKMRKIKDEIHVLYLSGYDEFDFVYSAIKQEADDYILKTEGDAMIVEAMKKMLLMIEKNNSFIEEYQSVQNKILYMEPAYKQQAIGYILDGIIGTEEEFDLIMADLEKPIAKQAGFLIIIGSCKEINPRKVQENILETVRQLLMKAYTGKIDLIHNTIYRNNFVWMIETEEAELPKLLLISVVDIQEKIQKNLGILICFGIAAEVVKWYELSGKYMELWEQIQRSVINEENNIILENTRKNQDFNGEDSTLTEMFGTITERFKLLKEQLDTDNFTAFRYLLKELLRILSEAKRHSMYALEIFYYISNILISYINKTNIRIELTSRIQLIALFDPGVFHSWKQAADYIFELTDAIEEIRNTTNRNDMANIAEKTKSYIITHIADDLCLTKIGSVMGFNPVYLARIFKQFEKEGIRNYIENCRMELAYQLIMNSRLKIFEIAEKCGYQNTAYFIKIYKNHYNMTPQECRERMNL
ncbi:response regulator transcription factor [Anaerocolumna sp. MB42-C2]|uniref:response regulator transcription factor n=1 Tax=Anaerocolumna sp. MB42-C2 TaxID=3070997 RepID=UPI0027E21666|nr:response regulator [Anaerocolumna sp. MB42-C2]WMJ86813.1 response regulator [Anaerocolumna sp. MB42-C2]